MWNRGRTWLLLLALIGVALAVYFEPTHCVRGWLWGEAFFDGRPTSYWRGVVERDLSAEFPQPQRQVRVFDGGAMQPSPTWWEYCKSWIGHERFEFSPSPLMNADSQSILEELAADRDPDIAAFARDALKVHWKPNFLVPIPRANGILLLDRYQLLIIDHSKNPQTRRFAPMHDSWAPLQ